MLLGFELRDEAFLDYIDGVKNSFNAMIETMKAIAENIKDETQQVTPVETGRLSRSYRWKIVTDNSRMKVLQIQMSALNPRTGYDYAWIQHENFGYNHEAKELGFYNYRRRTGLNEKGYETHFSNLNLWEFHKGRAWYLRSSIISKKNESFEMLERDYLSMFEYGGIF